jgi:hypothetical protein
MSKIKQIEVTNLKAIDHAEANFDGHTAIITASNNKGKTSFITAIVDRIRGERPELILKEGTDSGKASMELTTGEKFVWEFDDEKKDKLVFYTRDGIKTSVTKEISARFFAPVFDIDKFLNSQPKQQSKMLQDLAGIDFTEIDAKYKAAYADRTGKNAIAKNALAKLQATPEVEKVDVVDVSELQVKIQQERDRLNQLYQDNRKVNDALRAAHDKAKKEASTEYHNNLEKQAMLRGNKMKAEALLDDLRSLGYSGSEVAKFIESMPTIETVEEPVITFPEYTEEMPDQSTLDALTAQLTSASETNSKAQAYENRLKIVAEVKEATEAAEKADEYVKEIEAQRKQMILDSKFPQGIEISEDGVLVEGMPMDKKQISTSKMYITALKLAAMNLAQVRTLHFDASPLDRDNLNQIQKWAEENDLQLLIERPSFDDQEIQYEIVDTTV